LILSTSRQSGILDMKRDLLPAPPAEATGSGAPDIPDQFEEVFEPEQEVVFPPGKTFRFVRLLEPRALGDNTVEASFRLNVSGWTGRVEAEPIKFKVESSPADDELFKAKFERYLALCRSEYEESPSNCYQFRMYDLGPAAVGLLAAAIEDSPDPEFRQRMGYALTNMATAEALPTYRRLLDATLESDGRIALDGLARMIGRSQARDKALDMLLTVLGHTNTSLRLGAAERLRVVRDARVATAMQTAVTDTNPRTALVAARYLAAYAEVPLSDWLAQAAEQPTVAHRLAAVDIIRQLERDWHLDFGDLPLATAEDLADDSPQLAQYRKVLRAWEQWARENPRSSEHFFDAEREEWTR
jgi:hypothetical protein